MQSSTRLIIVLTSSVRLFAVITAVLLAVQRIFRRNQFAILLAILKAIGGGPRGRDRRCENCRCCLRQQRSPRSADTEALSRCSAHEENKQIRKPRPEESGRHDVIYLFGGKSLRSSKAKAPCPFSRRPSLSSSGDLV